VKKTERWDRLANTCWLTVPWNRRKMKNDLTTIANKWLAARGLSLGLGGPPRSSMPSPERRRTRAVPFYIIYL
jgi:hypothetical protein